jgi:integral membrane protein (TIGR00529 family)
LGLLSTPFALIFSFAVLGIMLYRRVNLGITLNATALLLGFLALDWWQIPVKIYETSVDLLTISIVLSTFGVMLLSELYKETKMINRLSESLSRIIRNPKIVITVLPAVLGVLPVAGGALMSAPLVDSEAEKLGLKPQKKAYTNLWFRHTIFPLYPLGQVLIVTAALSGTNISSIIIRNVPVVAVMVIVGYVIGFWKTPNRKDMLTDNGSDNNFRDFLVAFSPIMVTIVVAVGLSMTPYGLSKQGFDVLIATFIGLIVLIAVSKTSFKTFAKSLKNWGIYSITFAAYGAFLLGNMIKATEIGAICEAFVASGSADTTLLLTIIPAVLGVLTASALGGVSIAMPILGGVITLSPRTASLIYISAYLGYVISPTHLCFAFTAEYFKCHLGKIYKYVIPSFIVTFAAVLLVYFLIL